MKARTPILFVVALAAAASIGFLAGYQRAPYRWDASPRPGGITLAKVLRERGVSPESIAYIRCIGDESSFTTGRAATNTVDVEWIWDRMIETAEPYSFWESSGFRRVEIYTRDKSQPAAMLLVNATDATEIAGDGRHFMCHGLHDFVMQLLGPPQTAKIE